MKLFAVTIPVDSNDVDHSWASLLSIGQPSARH